MLFYASSVLAFVAAVAAQSLTVNTPAAVVQCQPAQITWTATNSPVFLSVIPGGQAGATALQDFGQQSGNSFTWNPVNIPAGTSITVQVRDSTGAVAYSAPVTIQSSSDSSCLGPQASTAPASTSAAATTPVTSSAPATTAQPTTSAAVSVSSVISSVASSAASSVSSVISTATAPATTPRPSSSAASVVSSSTRSGTASGAAASPTSTNGAMPTAKVGLAGLLGLAAAVVMA